MHENSNAWTPGATVASYPFPFSPTPKPSNSARRCMHQLWLTSPPRHARWEDGCHCIYLTNAHLRYYLLRTSLHPLRRFDASTTAISNAGPLTSTCYILSSHPLLVSLREEITRLLKSTRPVKSTRLLVWSKTYVPVSRKLSSKSPRFKCYSVPIPQALSHIAKRARQSGSEQQDAKWRNFRQHCKPSFSNATLIHGISHHILLWVRQKASLPDADSSTRSRRTFVSTSPKPIKNRS